MFADERLRELESRTRPDAGGIDHYKMSAPSYSDDDHWAAHYIIATPRSEVRPALCTFGTLPYAIGATALRRLIVGWQSDRSEGLAVAEEFARQLQKRELK